jgi:phosphate/phosphite/phosphonate ABC transporter binding protein
MWSGCSRRDPSDAEGRRTLRVTGIPDENPTELARKYDPMVEYLEARLGTRVEYVPVTDYGAAVQALAAGKVDFAWLGGFTHVQARVMAGAIPLCMRDIDREFKTVFIANRASGIASPTDLEDKTFAFGAKSSTSGHLMARHFLVTRFHMDPEKDLQGNPVYSGAHDATVKLVESGKVQAGALNIEVWDRMVRDKQVDTTAVAVIARSSTWTRRSPNTPRCSRCRARRSSYSRSRPTSTVSSRSHAASVCSSRRGAARTITAPRTARRTPQRLIPPAGSAGGRDRRSCAR